MSAVFSYHNGSVWPHDNGVAAMGLARAGHSAGVLKILDGLFATAVQLRTGSLPELFCGFKRESNLAPVPYPVACHPQAWSAASVFMILQALLATEVRGFERQLVIESRCCRRGSIGSGLRTSRSAKGRRFPSLPAVLIHGDSRDS